MFSGAIFVHFGADCLVFPSSGAIFACFGAAGPSNHRFRAKNLDFGAGGRM